MTPDSTVPSDTKSCAKCGRTGTRSFVADGDTWVCTAKWSCQGRAADANAKKREAGFKETAEDLNVPANVQGNLKPAPVPSDTNRLAEPAPLTDEQVARFAELIDMHRQYGPALSIEGEAQLLVEVLRLRAENTDMRRRVSYAAAIVSGDAAEMLGDELHKARAENQQLQGRLDTAEGQLAKVGRIIEPRDPNWKPLSERYPEHFKRVTDEERARRNGWDEGVSLMSQRIKAVLDGKSVEDFDGVVACTGCGKCSYCRKRGVTAADVLGLGEGDGRG